MFHRRETQHTLGERGILGDEAAAELLTTVEQLRTEVSDLKARVDSQFTTIAAHAEIARQQAEFARDEARSDLERTRETLIGLIEQVRTPDPDLHVAGTAPGASTEATTERVGQVERRIDDLTTTVERCFARQNELADTMAAFLDTVLAEQRGEPVAGLSMG
jgi:type I site-specific restriction endonuclease